MHLARLSAALRGLAACAALACAAQTAAAFDPPSPEGEVLLTVTGEIAAANAGEAAVFDLAMLQGLEAESFVTTTIWTEGRQEFTGTPLRALLDALGVEGGTLSAMAINDYAVEIPVSDAVEDGPIVAYMRNGRAMSVRDKGPLWIVYPYDANAAYSTEQIYARSIWQLDRIEVRR